MNGIGEEIREDNERVLSALSCILNFADDRIAADDVEKLVSSYKVTEEYAYALLLASLSGMDIADNRKDKELFRNYYLPMVKKLSAEKYENDFYYKTVTFENASYGTSELTYEKYKPYQAFVRDDMTETEEGRIIPAIGFFDREFIYPCVKDGGRLWMSVTPNEIETIRKPLERAFGKVLTLGLGLGYFAGIASEKNNVESVTVVENNENIIKLFREFIMPQIKNADKIKIVNRDAFDFLGNNILMADFDYCFADLWHDVSDGIVLYEMLKKYEGRYPCINFDYWIEKSIKCYI